MACQLFRPDDYLTTDWSGGTTTQLAISPEGAVYAEHSFLWRLSSARVELEHSDFTPLPDYDRFIAPLRGDLRLKVGDGAPFDLAPREVYAFSGAVPVQSWGRCVDFNLMLRRGECEGDVRPLALPPAGELTVQPPLLPTKELPDVTLCFYCVEGEAELPDRGVSVRAGELALCRDVGTGAVRLTGKGGAVLMSAAIRSRKTS